VEAKMRDAYNGSVATFNHFIGPPATPGNESLSSLTLDDDNIQLQYADVWEGPFTKFTATTDFTGLTTDPNFLRVEINELKLPIFFGGIFGVTSLATSATAVAAAVPAGPCEIMPIAVCAQPQADPSLTCSKSLGDTWCYGYPFHDQSATENCHQNQPSLQGGVIDPYCGIQLAGKDPDPQSSPGDWEMGSGNFHWLSYFDSNSASALREALAGGIGECIEAGTLANLQSNPGSATGPTFDQGLGTRFGDYLGPYSSPQSDSQTLYPPDWITADTPTGTSEGSGFNAFGIAYSNLGISSLTLSASPKYHRRAVIHPVIDCSVPINGTAPVTMVGGMCLFLTQRPAGGSEKTVYGEIIERDLCPTTLQPNSESNAGFFLPMLIKDSQQPKHKS
ncbi:MAG: hypothetical protein KAJ63_04375, partial [Methyloprofundus sp.]|nr:hypothetical protein [Methyloprofundus sp.]